MPSKILSGTLTGIDAQLVQVETEVSYGLRTFDIVGLPDKAIEEAKERIAVALKSSHLDSPRSKPARVLVNLAPADVKKEGALYDLPIALGYLTAARTLHFDPQEKFIIGELSLDGSLRPIRGALLFSLLAQQSGFREILLPKENAPEAAVVNAKEETLRIIPIASLKEAVHYLRGDITIEPFSFALPSPQRKVVSSFSLIKGQEYAKRALEIAAAGNHNLFFSGPPGTGKSLLAQSLISLLPELEFEEALEVTKIYSAAGVLPQEQPLLTEAPFRSPHHSSSEAALIGGGNPPRAGEITLAHRGILFLDEFPEFHRDVIESLRQPLESGTVSILRSRYRASLPASFMLIAAANPCPCGFYRNPDRECVCSPSSVQKYRRKLSGPLMDRIDMFIEVPQVKFEELIAEEPPDTNEEKIRSRIKKARLLQQQRLGVIKKNAQMDLQEIATYCQVDAQSKELLGKYVDSGKLSARGYHRILKLARTIADLAEQERIAFSHIAEALSYRLKED